MTWSALRIASSSCSTTNHGIADIAQMSECSQQTFVVALVQANGWLVEDVHHAHQAGADLADARRIRCASPPDSVSALRSKVR